MDLWERSAIMPVYIEQHGDVLSAKMEGGAPADRAGARGQDRPCQSHCQTLFRA